MGQGTHNYTKDTASSIFDYTATDAKIGGV